MGDLSGLEYVSPLERLRILRGLNQQEAALLLGMDNRMLRGQERGQWDPLPRTVARFAKFYEVDAAELMNEIRAWRASRTKKAAA